MDQHLRGLFERAVETEPLGPPEDLARAAMVEGTRLRRRRRLVAGGGTVVLVAGFVAAVVLTVPAPAADPAPAAGRSPSVFASAGGPECVRTVPDRATEFYIRMRADATDQERVDLLDALRADPLVREIQFEEWDQAFQRFEALWRDSGDPAEPGALFRFKYADPARFASFSVQFVDRPGVVAVLAGACRGAGE